MIKWSRNRGKLIIEKNVEYRTSNKSKNSSNLNRISNNSRGLPHNIAMNHSSLDSYDQQSYKNNENMMYQYQKSDSWGSASRRMSDKSKKGFPMGFGKNAGSSFMLDDQE